MSIRIDVIPNQYGTRAVLPRRTWCEGRRVRHRTVANLTGLDPAAVDGFRAVPGGGLVPDDPRKAFAIRRPLPHGHVAAALGTMGRPGLVRILGRRAERPRDPAPAAVVARFVDPASRLATARALDPETATTGLGTLLGPGPVTGNGTLSMLDWLPGRQPWTGKGLANRHLEGGNTLILYDVSPGHLEGRRCPLAAFGHNRDGKKGRRQITYGLPCAADGCPVAVEVLPGNTADPTTVASQADRIRGRFGVGRVAPGGDRGMLTTARIRGDLQPTGPGWISALRAADIRRLPREGPGGAPAPPVPEALVPDAVAEVTGPDLPGGRLVVCPSPRLRQERARRRGDLPVATGETPAGIAAAAARRKPGPANRRRVARHFGVDVRDGGMDRARDRDRIAAGARPGGVHVIRTSLGPEAMGTEAAVEAYRSPAGGGRTFRNDRTDLRIRPVHVYSGDHVRAHVFLCMPALHVEWHMRRRLAPMLSGDGDRGGARIQRISPVEPARVPERAEAKADTKRAPDGLPVHSLRAPRADLGTLTLNDASLPGRPDSRFRIASEPTGLQAKAFGLLSGWTRTQRLHKRDSPNPAETPVTLGRNRLSGQ